MQAPAFAWTTDAEGRETLSWDVVYPGAGTLHGELTWAPGQRIHTREELEQQVLDELRTSVDENRQKLADQGRNTTAHNHLLRKSIGPIDVFVAVSKGPPVWRVPQIEVGRWRLMVGWLYRSYYLSVKRNTNTRRIA